MVIDAAKGIEAQTLKLFEVCRLRDIPIITFVNKVDREGRDPIEMLDEIADHAGARRLARGVAARAGLDFKGTSTCQDGASCRRQDELVRRLRHLDDLAATMNSRPSSVIKASLEEPRTGARRLPGLRSRDLPRRPPDAGVLRLGAEGRFGVARTAGCAGANAAPEPRAQPA